MDNELCSACNGSGEGYYTTNDKCMACNGKGIEENLMHTEPETALEHYWFDLGHKSNKIAEENRYLNKKLFETSEELDRLKAENEQLQSAANEIRQDFGKSNKELLKAIEDKETLYEALKTYQGMFKRCDSARYLVEKERDEYKEVVAFATIESASRRELSFLAQETLAKYEGKK